jgi:hypothetical protein
MSEINTANKFLIALRDNNLISMKLGFDISTDDALILAAYLVAMSMKDKEEFDKVYEAVCNS